jgi:hypothetical protein
MAPQADSNFAIAPLKPRLVCNPRCHASSQFHLASLREWSFAFREAFTVDADGRCHALGMRSVTEW